MKLDKETLLKEHFWFLLALAVPLALVSLILLWVTSAGPIAAKEKTIKDAEADLKRVQSSKPKHPRWLDALKKREDSAIVQQKKVWEKNWKDQEKLMTWPASFRPEYLEQLNQMYFGDDIPGESIRSAYPSNYQDQIRDIIDLAQPRNGSGQVMVQPHDSWETLLRLMPESLDAWKNPPTSEDLWLAQEDLWVQRGLLQIVRDVNDAVASFTGKGAGQHMVFTNPDWMLDLTLAQDDKGKPIVKYRLTNIGSRRQNLGFSFEITFAGVDTHGLLPIDGEPLAPGKSIPAEGEQVLPGKAKPGEWVIDVGRPSSLKSVRQVFDWRTVPVKRVDKIVMGALSHRQSTLELKPAKVFADQKDANTAPGPATSQPSRGVGGKPIAETPGTTHPGGAAAEDLSKNGLVRKRYISTTAEVRRMPVAMVLIVDQAHMQDVLTAVANSPLRIQVTQWLWRRYHGDIKPREEEKTNTANGESGRDGRPQRIPVGGRPEGTPPAGIRPGVRPGVGPGGYGQPGTGTAAEEQEWDLIEISIYGVASLYERYPPKQPKAEAAATPQTGTTPAAGPAAATPRPATNAAPAPSGTSPSRVPPR